MNQWTQRLSKDQSSRPKDHRDPYQRDKARILHSAAFRRLQSKTQVLSVGQDDFYRTRLTHSLEVAQIGTGLIAQLRQSQQIQDSAELDQLLPTEALIEALCLAHDLGHPPFGHGGEVALNYVMRNHGGFEGNGQTFRIITHLEPYTEHFGMDLTRRTCLGLLKYPAINPITSSPSSEQADKFIKAKDWQPNKAIYQDDSDAFNWVLQPLTDNERAVFCQTESGKTRYKSLDASIMEIADDIAYAVHDLEDAITLNYVSQSQWTEQALPQLLKIDNLWSQKYAGQLSDMLFSNQHHLRKNAIGALVNHLITNIAIDISHANFVTPEIKYNAVLTDAAKALLQVLKTFVYHNLIMKPEIQQLEFRGQRMLINLFDAFYSDPQRLLPNEIKTQFNQTQSPRVICDHLASMSDQLAIKTYRTLFASLDS